MFVDTNILMYAHDVSAGDKHAKARDLIDGLWDTMQGAVSTQVLQELTVNLRRKAAKPLDRRAAREIIEDYLAWHVVVNDGRAVLEALDLEERYQISFWDALIIHAAQLAGADTLYSEDLSNGQRYGTVRVVNPFLASDAPQDERGER